MSFEDEVHDGDNSKYEDPIKLAFELKKGFLHWNATNTPNVLLLTGQAGIGKSLFCHHLQKDLLNVWKCSQNQENDERLWFPIYVDPSRLKEINAMTIMEIMIQDLNLTEEEIQTLQGTESRILNVMFIFDGCDRYMQKALEQIATKGNDLTKYNLWKKLGTEIWKNARFIATCREETLLGLKKSDLTKLFAPLLPKQDSLPLFSELFMQRKIAPFSDERITSYLKNCYFFDFLSVPTESNRESTNDNLNTEGLRTSSSWNQVKQFEELIDHYDLREVARTPFMLKVMNSVLASFAAEDNNRLNLNERKSLRGYYLIEHFVDHEIKSLILNKLKIKGPRK